MRSLLLDARFIAEQHVIRIFQIRNAAFIKPSFLPEFLFDIGLATDLSNFNLIIVDKINGKSVTPLN